VLDNPTERERLSRAGRERARAVHWERAAAATVAVYREALQLQTELPGAPE
jgi:glycosyltransferase involved in cell wall biosynthesis